MDNNTIIQHCEPLLMLPETTKNGNIRIDSNKFYAVVQTYKANIRTTSGGYEEMLMVNMLLPKKLVETCNLLEITNARTGELLYVDTMDVDRFNAVYYLTEDSFSYTFQPQKCFFGTNVHIMFGNVDPAFLTTTSYLTNHGNQRAEATMVVSGPLSQPEKTIYNKKGPRKFPPPMVVKRRKISLN